MWDQYIFVYALGRNFLSNENFKYAYNIIGLSS